MAAILQSKKFLAVACAMAGVLVGCAADRDGRGEPRQDAVMCTTCKTIWVEPPDRSAANVPTYSPAGWLHRCPDCHDAVVSFFRTGRFEHTCERCGDALVHCTEHPM